MDAARSSPGAGGGRAATPSRKSPSSGGRASPTVTEACGGPSMASSLSSYASTASPLRSGQAPRLRDTVKRGTVGTQSAAFRLRPHPDDEERQLPTVHNVFSSIASHQRTIAEHLDRARTEDRIAEEARNRLNHLKHVEQDEANLHLLRAKRRSSSPHRTELQSIMKFTLASKNLSKTSLTHTGDDGDRPNVLLLHKSGRLTEFRPDELEDLRLLFNLFDETGTGRLGLEDLARLLTALGFSLSAQDATALFERVDMSDTASLTFEDFTAAMAGRQDSFAPTRAFIREWFLMIDLDRKGYLELPDLRRVLGHTHSFAFGEADLLLMLRQYGARPDRLYPEEFARMVRETLWD